jgi:CheY-like chemotaxis protein
MGDGQTQIHLPVIAVTSHGQRADLLSEGFAELVEKPLDPLALCKLVRQHVQAPA